MEKSNGLATRDTARMQPGVVGQYLGFGAILAFAVIGAMGASLLPESVRPYLGLVPLRPRPPRGLASLARTPPVYLVLVGIGLAILIGR